MTVTIMVFSGGTNLRPSLLEFYQPLLQQFLDEFSCAAERDRCETQANQRQRGGGKGKEGGRERVRGRMDKNYPSSEANSSSSLRLSCPSWFLSIESNTSLSCLLSFSPTLVSRLL